jgi:alpha-beta hydrolase superfamily lysophospholipase
MNASPFAPWLLTGAILWPGVCAGQDKEKKKAEPAPDLPKNAAVVALQTEDGVVLVATYWKPKKGSKSTGVVVFPNPRSHTQRECYTFAEEMTTEGLAVVTFDFRGSGQSTQSIATGTSKKSDSGMIRSEDVLRNAQTIDKLTLDLDAIKQFLLRENNAEKLNIRQYSILAVGDLASVVAMNWIATREFGSKNDYTRDGGDIAALCIVSPAVQYKGYKAPQRLGDPGDKLPIYLISAGGRSPSFEASERISRLLKLPDISAKKGSDDRRSRPGGWNKVAAKKAVKGQSPDVGIELFHGPETAELRRGILGFLLDRKKARRDIAWEGGRDVDQSFKIISRSDQE